MSYNTSNTYTDGKYKYVFNLLDNGNVQMVQRSMDGKLKGIFELNLSGYNAMLLQVSKIN